MPPILLLAAWLFVVLQPARLSAQSLVPHAMSARADAVLLPRGTGERRFTSTMRDAPTPSEAARVLGSGRCPPPKVALATAGGGGIGALGGYLLGRLASVLGGLPDRSENEYDPRRPMIIGFVVGAALGATIAIRNGADC